MPGLYDEVLAAGGWDAQLATLRSQGWYGLSPQGYTNDPTQEAYVAPGLGGFDWLNERSGAGLLSLRNDSLGGVANFYRDANGQVTPQFLTDNRESFGDMLLEGGRYVGSVLGAAYGLDAGLLGGAPAGAGASPAGVSAGGPVVSGGAGAIGSTGLQSSWFAPGGLEAVTSGAGVVGAAGTAGGFSGLGGLGGRDLVNIGSGLYGLYRSNQIADRSDPFAQYRGFYGQKLMDLENNPSLVTQLPGWQAGLEAIQRQMGAQGYLGSGNHSAALSRYAGDFTNQTLARYAMLAGAGQSPGAGQTQSADLAGRSLASIGYGLAPLFPRIGG